jgi:hypothetical protein
MLISHLMLNVDKKLSEANKTDNDHITPEEMQKVLWA